MLIKMSSEDRFVYSIIGWLHMNGAVNARLPTPDNLGPSIYCGFHKLH